MLRIDSISIENILGISKAEFPLGSLTVITGDNGTGKTSILEAVRCVFDGGHDPSLIHNGEDKGVVCLTLSNGTTIKRTITPKSSTLDIRTAEGLKVAKPAAFVEKLASGFAYDPLAFLDADEKKRQQFLLEAMPVQFLPEEISGITGKQFSRPLGLEEFGQLRASIYEQRADVNREIKMLNGAEESIRAALPEDDGEDWPAKAGALSDRKAALAAEVEKVKGSIAGELKDAIREQDVVLQTAIDAARLVFETACKAAKDAYTEAVTELRQLAQSAESEKLAEINAELQSVSAELATAEEKRRQQDRATAARNEAKRLRDQISSSSSVSLKLTMQIEKLDALKVKVLSESAIPGVEIADGKILVDGVELDRLNTQRQYFLAFQIASLKQGDLGFMVCDRTESIVGEQWAEFMAAAEQSGFQVMAARSEAGKPLTVEIGGEAFALKAEA